MGNCGSYKEFGGIIGVRRIHRELEGVTWMYEELKELWKLWDVWWSLGCQELCEYRQNSMKCIKF